MPRKLEIQISSMKNSGSMFSSTEGYFGEGRFTEGKKYPLYNEEKFYSIISKKYSKTIFSSKRGRRFMYPDIWTYDFLKVHNCVITSSVIVEKNLMNVLGGFRFTYH